MAHPPRIPVWLPLGKEVVYFITPCVQDRQPVLANAAALRALEVTVSRLTHWWIYAAVLMPDHLHLLAAPDDRDEDVGNLSAAIKRRMRQELKADWQWQTGCFDRLLRSEDSAQTKWEYMGENPVRAGLVKAWSDWPNSIGLCGPLKS
jgi:putative transposase